MDSDSEWRPLNDSEIDKLPQDQKDALSELEHDHRVMDQFQDEWGGPITIKEIDGEPDSDISDQYAIYKKFRDKEQVEEDNIKEQERIKRQMNETELQRNARLNYEAYYQEKVQRAITNYERFYYLVPGTGTKELVEEAFTGIDGFADMYLESDR